MKTIFKAISITTLSLAVSFICVGYAALSDSLIIEGTVQTSPPEALYIVDVQTSGGNAVVTSVYDNVWMSSTVTLENSDDAEETFTISFYNNTDTLYYFNAILYPSDTTTGVNDYTYVEYEFTFAGDTDTNPKNFQVAAGATVTGYLTFKYKDGTASSNNSVTSILHFDFSTTELEEGEGGAGAVEGALDKFSEILNDTTTYNTLIGQMESGAASNWWEGGRDDSYISNVDGAQESDQTVINDLFGSDGTIMINGVETPVKILIKNEDLNSDNSNEMTIYMTTNDLEKESTYAEEDAIVYACIFAKDATGTWVQLGDMIQGTAPIVSYNGWRGNGSFNTDEWVSTDNKTIETIVADRLSASA